MKKRTFYFGMALILVVAVLLTGCGSKQPAAAKTIVMGTNAEFPPFEFEADEGKGLVGQFDGVDVAIAKQIAEDMGVTLQIENMAFDSLIMALESGKIDFIAAAMTVNAEREESCDFTEKYYKAVQLMLVKADNTEIKSFADLSGKVAGVQQGTTGDFICSDVEDIETVRYVRALDAVLDLKSGKIDAVVVDSMPATMFFNENKNELKLLEDKEAFEDEEYAIAIKKGNSELLAQINKTILKMKDSGKIDELVNQYS